MPATIPSLTRKIDTLYTTTWQDVQKKATDNILVDNVVSALLKEKGCYKAQSGGLNVTRTVRYGTKTAFATMKGDTLPTGEDELETAAIWDWKYIAVRVQRNVLDEQKNWGSGRIKDRVALDIAAARDALNAKFESCFLAAIDTVNGGAALRAARDPYSIWNFLPDVPTSNDLPAGTYVPTTAGSYHYGGIDVGGSQAGKTLNYWWQGKYGTATSPFLMNGEDDLRRLYNNIGAGGSDLPDVGLMSQTMYESCEDLFGGKMQIVHNVGDSMAKLGYESLQYRNAKLYWTPSSAMTAGTILLLNTKWIDVVYDPGLWFSMTEWQDLPNQLDRVATIICTFTGPICYQLRRQGRLGTYTS